MIIVRSPLRISLGGGGTDLPSYYEENEGFLLTAAINKFVYITMHENFMDEILVKLGPLHFYSSFSLPLNYTTDARATCAQSLLPIGNGNSLRGA